MILRALHELGHLSLKGRSSPDEEAVDSRPTDKWRIDIGDTSRTHSSSVGM